MNSKNSKKKSAPLTLQKFNYYFANLKKKLPDILFKINLAYAEAKIQQTGDILNGGKKKPIQYGKVVVGQRPDLFYTPNRSLQKQNDAIWMQVFTMYKNFHGKALEKRMSVEEFIKDIVNGVKTN